MSRKNSAKQEIDWARLYQVCVGMVGIRPDDFWHMSLNEVYLAIDGFKEFNGVQDEGPLTTDELDKLMELNPD